MDFQPILPPAQVVVALAHLRSVVGEALLGGTDDPAGPLDTPGGQPTGCIVGEGGALPVLVDGGGAAIGIVVRVFDGVAPRVGAVTV